MKILLAVLVLALAAALLVSATLGAGTLLPGDHGAGKPPRMSAGGARLVPAGSGQLVVNGIGFEPGEKVTVSSTDDAVDGRRTVQADASGSFVVRTGRTVDRCNGGTIVATGDKGTKASLKFSPTACAVPGTAG
jgi:hypothetical protein